MPPDEQAPKRAFLYARTSQDSEDAGLKVGLQTEYLPTRVENAIL